MIFRWIQGRDLLLIFLNKEWNVNVIEMCFQRIYGFPLCKKQNKKRSVIVQICLPQARFSKAFVRRLEIHWDYSILEFLKFFS